ncbi:MAG TPA: asparagine synthase-related protein [Gemmatimonadaceae bacterium]|nr:asparagine synthase-related protein [Gemmatimonadaceae bacterium]
MSFFVCSTGRDGTRHFPQLRADAMRRHAAGYQLHMLQDGGLRAALASNGVGPIPVSAQGRWLIAVGTLRLDSREEIRVLADSPPAASDLELVVSAFERHGPRIVSRIIGDFALVIHDARTCRTFAARDAFGVGTLYIAGRSDELVFSSRADVAAAGIRDWEYVVRRPDVAAAAPDARAFDADYLAELLANAAGDPMRTAFRGVRALPPAHLLIADDEGLRFERYWHPARHTHRTPGTSGECVQEFGRVFAEGVQLRLTGADDTWAQLSGGLDSSSVVSMAATLERDGAVGRALGGTLTLVDTRGTGGDEREFSGAVIERFGLRNEQIVDHGWWGDDDMVPPLTDRPTPAYLAYGRDHRLATIARAAGGRVLLSGYGSDQYLGGSAIFLADWMAHGRVLDALREAARWAAIGRVSFWKLAWHNAVVPLLPPRLRRRSVPETRVPSWIPPALVRRLELEERSVVQHAYEGPFGGKYVGDILRAVLAMADVPALHAVIQESIEERHPFLHRPLVELALSLPPDMCAQPCARKWVLRQAMRGLLPEVVRTRRGKGSVDGQASWALVHERERIDLLLHEPLLADMGCVDAVGLRDAIRAAAHGGHHLRAEVIRALALETWLRARMGVLSFSGRRSGRGSEVRQYA